MKREGANFNRKTALWGSAVLAVLGPVGLTTAFGQVSFSNTAGLAYSQNFNGLANTGTAPWVNNNHSGLSAGASPASTAGWYAWAVTSATTPTSLTASAGSNTAGLYSFGTGTGTDRALGAYPNNGTGAFYVGLQLQYTGSISLNQLQVIYRGEVWQDSQNETTTMTFEYAVSNSSIAINSGSVTWNPVTQLAYQYTGDGSSSAEDGNATGNFSTKNFVITGNNLITTANNFIMLRWTIPNTGGADHGFAIDDVVVAVPEATTWAAGAFLGVAVFAGYRRTRR